MLPRIPPEYRRLRTSIGLVGLVNVSFAAWILLMPGSHERFVTGDNLAQLCGMLLGVALCIPPRHLRGVVARLPLAGSRIERVPHTHNWSPLLLGLAILCQAIGQVIYTYYEDVRHQAILFPSWADAAYLSVYPFALLGILLLARRPAPLQVRAGVMLDGLLIMTALVTFSWYFILGPTVLQARKTPFETAVGGAYPLGDLLLMVCLLLLAARAMDARLRFGVGLLAVALASIVLTDSVYDCRLLHNGYATGSLLDVGWAFGYSMLGLGVRALRYADAPASAVEVPRRPEGAVPAAPSLWRALLPYAAIPALAALVAYARWKPAAASLDGGVYLGGVVLILLVVIRQVSTILEVVAANRALRTMYTNNVDLALANTQLDALASTDALTGLPNRLRLHTCIEQALVEAQRAGSEVALLLMDLDRFKEVNDTLGHQYGDMLLQQIGPRVQGAMRKGDALARLGGDEFAVILPEAGVRAADRVAEAILRAIERPFGLDGHAVDVGASVGVALYPAHGADATALLRCADIALYVAKNTHSGVSVYDPSQDSHNASRLTLMGDLRAAIAEGGLQLYYQPKVGCADDRPSGVEALLRWCHPVHGFIPPDGFIPLAEQTGQIAPLTEWVLRTALAQGQAWNRRGIALDLAVNLSARSLHDNSLPNQVAELLQSCNYPPTQLTLEITESALMIDPTRARDVLTRLVALGVHISIDDFGTGYSSLGYLKRLPVDEIKLDKSFILEIVGNARDAALARSIIAMAHALDLSIVAEGVETREAWALLRTLGCDAGQGYYLSRPVPASDLERWVEGRLPSPSDIDGNMFATDGARTERRPRS